MSTFAVFFNRICEMDFLPKDPAILVSSVRSALPLGSSSMKKLILLSIILIVSVSVSAQDIAGFVSRQMETYPQSRLLDIYKSSADKLFIDSILSVGKYAISHSPEYREAYHPHYRIVDRNIFDREILTLIKKWHARMQMNFPGVINPNALKMPKYDPYRKKFNDMQLIDIFGSHLKR